MRGYKLKIEDTRHIVRIHNTARAQYNAKNQNNARIQNRM
jgi:hypothetical protein